MPKTGEHLLKFTNYGKQMELPYAIYADFESPINPIEKCFPNPNVSSTDKTSEHVPCGFAYPVVCADGEIHAPIHYRGRGRSARVSKQLAGDRAADTRALAREASRDEQGRLGVFQKRQLIVTSAENPLLRKTSRTPSTCTIQTRVSTQVKCTEGRTTGVV